MNAKHLFTACVTCVALFCQSCAGLGDDAFAHAVKSGNRAATQRLMQPYSGKLQIQERNGQWYNPLQYAIASGDEQAAFALLERGAPSSFDGKSLAYNAARVNQLSLAQRFVRAGYGDSSDVQQAAADARSAQQEQNRQSAAMAALGCVFIAALLGGGSAGSNSSTDDARMASFGDGIAQQNIEYARENRAAFERGQEATHPGIGNY